MNQPTKQQIKFKKTLQHIIFAAGLLATSIPLVNSAYHFGQNDVSLENIHQYNQQLSGKEILEKYDREKKLQGIAQGVGTGLLWSVFYVSTINAFTNKNKSYKVIDEASDEMYSPNLRL